MTIVVFGASCTFEADAESGDVIARHRNPGVTTDEPEYMIRISRFDVTRYRTEHRTVEDTEIGNIGFWLNSGIYVPPENQLQHIIIRGSGGIFHVSPVDGAVISLDQEGYEGAEIEGTDYQHITRFDVEEYRRHYGFLEDTDILLIGYWAWNGVYEPPEPAARQDAAEQAEQNAAEMADWDAVRNGPQEQVNFSDNANVLPESVIVSRMTEEPTAFTIQVLRIPDTQWVPTLPGGNYVWLVKERQLAVVSCQYCTEARFLTMPPTVLGEIGLFYQPGQTHGIHWYIDPYGCGFDGSQLLAPVVVTQSVQDRYLPMLQPPETWLEDYAEGHHLWFVPTNEIAEVVASHRVDETNSFYVRIRRYNILEHRWYETTWRATDRGWNDQDGNLSTGRLFLPLQRAVQAPGSRTHSAVSGALMLNPMTMADLQAWGQRQGVSRPQSIGSIVRPMFGSPTIRGWMHQGPVGMSCTYPPDIRTTLAAATPPDIGTTLAAAVDQLDQLAAESAASASGGVDLEADAAARDADRIRDVSLIIGIRSLVADLATHGRRTSTTNNTMTITRLEQDLDRHLVQHSGCTCAPDMREAVLQRRAQLSQEQREAMLAEVLMSPVPSPSRISFAAVSQTDRIRGLTPPPPIFSDEEMERLVDAGYLVPIEAEQESLSTTDQATGSSSTPPRPVVLSQADVFRDVDLRLMQALGAPAALMSESTSPPEVISKTRFSLPGNRFK